MSNTILTNKVRNAALPSLTIYFALELGPFIQKKTVRWPSEKSGNTANVACFHGKKNMFLQVKNNK